MLFEEDIQNNVGLTYFEIRDLQLIILESQSFDRQDDRVPKSIPEK
jgi:hypothetical protein